MKPRKCQAKKKDGNPCKGNAMSGYFCYVHQDSKDPVLVKDPLVEATRGLHEAITAVIQHHYRTGADISALFGNYKPPRKR